MIRADVALECFAETEHLDHRMVVPLLGQVVDPLEVYEHGLVV